MLEQNHEEDAESDTGESYYVSMTDMMVGIIFIFIIMLSYFALNFRATTASLTSAKDAQTSALLKIASNLKTREAQIQVDDKNHVLCVGGDVLGGTATDGDVAHCFAYTDGSPASSSASSSADESSALAAADQQALIDSVGSDLISEKINPASDKGGLTFAADQIFNPGTSDLSPQGRVAVQAVAHSLATRLPCYGNSSGPNCINDTRLLAVQVGARAAVDPTTQAGRDAGALTVQRTSAFYTALISNDPSLAGLRDPSGKPLIHVTSAISEAPGANGPQTIYVGFRMSAQ